MTFVTDATQVGLFEAGTGETDDVLVDTIRTLVWNPPDPGSPEQAEFTVHANNFDTLNVTEGTYISTPDFRLALGDPKLDFVGPTQRVDTTVEVAGTRGKILRQTIGANQYGPQPGQGMAIYAELPQQVDEATLKFDMRLSRGDGPVEWGKGGKLPGLGGVNDKIQPTRVVGANGPSNHGWSSRLGWITPSSNPDTSRSPAELIGYRYWPDQPQDWGSTLQTNYVPDENWHVVEQYVKLNDVGTANGVHRITVDGTVVFQATNVEWRVRDDVHITHIFWHIYRGGDRPSLDDDAYAVHSNLLADFDNLEVIGYNGGEVAPSTVWTSDQIVWTLTDAAFLTRVQTYAGEAELLALPVAETFDAGATFSGHLEWDSAVDEASFVEDDQPSNLVMVIAVLDPDLERAPTSATVVLSDGWPNTEVSFEIDGVLVDTFITDEDGDLPPTSLSVLEPLGKGQHTVTARQADSNDASAVFTLKNDPNLALVAIGADADPVEVPGAITPYGTRKWVLQDLLPGGLGSWVMPRNPKEMTSPFVDNALNSKHTTARSTGQFHITQGGTIPREWSFSGYTATAEEQTQLEAYRNLNRRFYIIDHRGRAWISVITDITWDHHLQENFDGEQTDWGADYQASVTTFDQDWRTPQ